MKYVPKSKWIKIQSSLSNKKYPFPYLKIWHVGGASAFDNTIRSGRDALDTEIQRETRTGVFSG
jgi:hypothetical protein